MKVRTDYRVCRRLLGAHASHMVCYLPPRFPPGNIRCTYRCVVTRQPCTPPSSSLELYAASFCQCNNSYLLSDLFVFDGASRSFSAAIADGFPRGKQHVIFAANAGLKALALARHIHLRD
jgi:hypothetical protein